MLFLDENKDAVCFDNTVAFHELDTAAIEMSGEILEEHQLLSSNKKPIAIILYTSGSTGVPKGNIILQIFFKCTVYYTSLFVKRLWKLLLKLFY